MGALVDPSRFNTSIEQENLTPKQPGYYIQKRKEEEEIKRQQEARMRSEPKTISSAPKLSTADQYSQVTNFVVNFVKSLFRMISNRRILVEQHIIMVITMEEAHMEPMTLLH